MTIYPFAGAPLVSATAGGAPFSVPMTSDETSFTLIIVVAAVSLVLVVLLAILGKKKK